MDVRAGRGEETHHRSRLTNLRSPDSEICKIRNGLVVEAVELNAVAPTLKDFHNAPVEVVVNAGLLEGPPHEGDHGELSAGVLVDQIARVGDTFALSSQMLREAKTLFATKEFRGLLHPSDRLCGACGRADNFPDFRHIAIENRTAGLNLDGGRHKPSGFRCKVVQRSYAVAHRLSIPTSV
jgi:hypothetical protein